MNRLSFAFLSVVCLVAMPHPAHAQTYREVLIDNVPHVRQNPDFSGEACAAMYLAKLGKQMDQDFVFDQSGLDPAVGRGCSTHELWTALRRIGFETGATWYDVPSGNSDEQMASLFTEMHVDLLAGVPSIICMHYDELPRSKEHFRLILGYDPTTDQVIYHEPFVERGAYRRMKRETLLKLWPLKYRKDKWLVIRLRLERQKLIDGQATHQFTDADYAQHIRRLKERLPHSDFHIVVQKPFVVIGDEDPWIVQRRAVNTVKWTVDRIKRDFFSRDPTHIIDIWLFKDAESYETHTEEILGFILDTPFGFYSPPDHSLFMNISTGTGTLVHEIVHPFIASNFPSCPAWFDEGLASLYEECDDRRGHIWGDVNWRLRGLHDAIREGSVPSFQQLCGTTKREFYNEDPGTNYSQARYLCYYLQQRGLLVKYYHEFRRSVKKDLTGFTTLQNVLGERDMDKFKDKWEEYVMTLRY